MAAKPAKKDLGPTPEISPEISPEMREYIKNSFSELRICTTCEGPLLFPVRISSPKPMDHRIAVEGRTLYISAVQAPRIKIIDGAMLPRCAIEKRRKCR